MDVHYFSNIDLRQVYICNLNKYLFNLYYNEVKIYIIIYKKYSLIIFVMLGKK